MRLAVRISAHEHAACRALPELNFCRQHMLAGIGSAPGVHHQALALRQLENRRHPAMLPGMCQPMTTSATLGGCAARAGDAIGLEP